MTVTKLGRELIQAAPFFTGCSEASRCRDHEALLALRLAR